MCVDTLDLRNSQTFSLIVGAVPRMVHVMKLAMILRHVCLAVVVLLSQEDASCQNTADVSPDQLLLKDFRPRSIYKIPVSRVEKARFPDRKSVV